MFDSDYSALIFDCDGVLVNSEVIIHEVEREFLDRLGLHYENDSFVRTFSGLTEAEFLVRIEQELQQKFDKSLPDNFREELRDAKRTAVDQNLTPISGARELALAWPKAKAVATSSLHHSVTRKLQKFDMLDIFDDHIYSAESVPQGKPNPAIFLYTAEKLAVDPRSCVVIEDSILGVQAAKRAGMDVIGFIGADHCLPDHGALLRDAGADHITERMIDIHALLGL